MGRYTYEIVPEIFAHDLDGEPLVAVPERFGLVDDSPDRWTKLFQKLEELNQSAKEGEKHKVVFCIRHGQGFHNVAEAKYGTEAWDDHWSKLNGDGEIVWGPDPLLTPTGIEQAKDVRKMWEKEISAGLGLPSKIYSSPLSRALRTCFITFDGLLPVEDSEGESRVLIVEDCREENGVHTCDKRNTRSWIQTQFPTYKFEEGFEEEDRLWSRDVRETKKEVGVRAGRVLDRIFDENPTEVFQAITAHNGFINGVLLTLGRRPYLLPTGGVLPLVLKATKVN
ncbi:hypothetical protein CC2G_013411 [Coprinopsis cinerea AmutBmut pab1-1]|nr:hypothetical protein CC2G_013411 [Coprinopsis cinerea AmutBmut pab1-1]